MNPIIYACDVGSIRSGAFAWARNDTLAHIPTASVDIDHLIASITQDARSGAPIALGFEAPLFLPVPDNSSRLTSGRNGESSRSMFAPAGAAVTTIGAQQTAWTLKQLHSALAPKTKLTFDWRSNWRLGEQLFIWEAFVSSSAHSNTHERDAATAVQYFLAHADDLDTANAVTCENPLSLIAASALWSGWLTDIQALYAPCLVLRPTEPYAGKIELS